MRNIRGITPSKVYVKDLALNVFCADFDGTEYILRQPRKADAGRQKLALRDMSQETLHRYRRANVDKRIYDINYRSKLPLYRGEVPGFLPLIMEVDDTIVGLVDIMLRFGTDFQRFLIKPEEKGMACSIGIIDKYHGYGYGTGYSYVTEEIGRHFGIDWILGIAHLKGGTFNIRARSGWETIRKYGEYADHKKDLRQKNTI
jgi:hypothetical protein